MFKDKLRELLDARQMKPADLAREAGLSEAIVSNYLSGKKEPMGKTCAKIANALHITTDELLDTGFETQRKEAPAVMEAAEALRIYAESKKGGPLTQEELNRLDDFAETFIKGLNK